MDPQQGGGTRDFTPLASGRLVITNSTTGSVLRVPVSAAVRLVSATTVSATSPVSALTVAGTGFDTSGTTDGNGYHGSASLLSVFTLGGSSPKKAACTVTVTTGCTQGRRDASGDLRYVGATSDYRAQRRERQRLLRGQRLVGVDRTRHLDRAVRGHLDGQRPGHRTPRLRGVRRRPRYPGNDQDYFGIWLHDFATGSDDWVADLNGLDPVYDSTPFDTDTLVIPVPLASLVPATGTVATRSPTCGTRSGTYSPYGYGADSVLDQIPPVPPPSPSTRRSRESPPSTRRASRSARTRTSSGPTRAESRCRSPWPRATPPDRSWCCTRTERPAAGPRCSPSRRRTPGRPASPEPGR